MANVARKPGVPAIPTVAELDDMFHSDRVWAITACVEHRLDVLRAARRAAREAPEDAAKSRAAIAARASLKRVIDRAEQFDIVIKADKLKLD